MRCDPKKSKHSSMVVYNETMEKINKDDIQQKWLSEIQHAFLDLNIPDHELLKFSRMLSGLYIKKGEYLVREGETPEKLAFIVSGIFRAFYLTELGDEKTIVFRGKGKPLSAYSSFVNAQTAKFSIQALEDSVLLYLSIEDFEELLSENPLWKMYTGQYYMTLFIEKEKRERELLSDDAKTRYIRFLKDYPGLEDRINHYHIASYLGISNVTLSRIRNIIINQKTPGGMS